MRRLALGLVLACSSPQARASEEEPAPAPRRPLVDPTRLHVELGGRAALGLTGDLDLVLQHVSEQPIAPVGVDDAALGPEQGLWTRLRFSPAVSLADPGSVFALWRLAAELDLLRDWVADGGRGLLAADARARSESGLVGERVSQLALTAAGPHVALQLGLVRSRWGLGLVSNPGDDPAPHRSESPFGFALQGDHVARLGVSFHPLGDGLARPPLTASLAFDAVVDDDTAVWADGDRAYQLIAAVSGRTERLDLGLYVAHRFQDHHEGGSTNVTVLDLTGRLQLAREDALSAYLEAEIATIRGRTSLSQSVMHEGSFDVDQLGGLMRFGIESGRFLGVLEFGAGSGDQNAFDDEQRAFSMDRDHRVGLLLFREVLAAQSAVTAHNVADPVYRGDPPRGHTRLATSGGVRGAYYVNPRLSFRLDEGLFAYGGLVYATSDGEYVDAFWSGLVGGTPRGPRNGAPSTELGWELDLGLAWAFRAEPLGLRLRLEGAWLTPGKVLADEAGRAAPDMWGLWVHGGMSW